LEFASIPFYYYDGAEYLRGLKDPVPETRILVHIDRQELNDTEVLFKGKTYQDLRDFVLAITHSQVMPSNPKTMHLIHQNDIPALSLYCGHLNSCQPYIQMLNASNTHNHKLLKIYKFDKQFDHEDLDNYTENEGEQPKLCIMDSRKGKLYHHWFKGVLNSENIEAFIERYFHLRPLAHHYSEHPENYHHTAAKSLTGHNYHREVEQSKRSILLLVHNGYDNETQLVDSFTQSAQYLQRHLHQSLKFRILDQRKNLTPIILHSTPCLVVVHVGHTHPDQFIHLQREGKGVEVITRYEIAQIAEQHMHVFLPNKLRAEMPRFKEEYLQAIQSFSDEPVGGTGAEDMSVDL
jgi:hypothetical protein